MSAIIRNPNPNLDSNDVWLLVLNGVVVTAIMDTTRDMNNSWVLNAYDYVIDLTMQGQNAGIGDMYNGSTNTFTIPPTPPVDYVENTHVDFTGFVQQLQQILVDAHSTGNLTPTQINAAYNSMLNDNPDLDEATLTLMQTILNYVIAGDINE